jgi:DNA invertase Pin-like site-specific DNA recombinase
VGRGDRVIGYARVSTEEQGVSGAGLAAQRRAIKTECDRRGWHLLRVEEDVLSGRKLNRPGLMSALDTCRSGEASGILVAKLDRLSRSLVDFAALLVEAQAKGFNVVAIDLGVALSTPAGEFLASVMASAAQWERRIIGQRTKEALAVRRDQGVKLGRPALPKDPLARRISAMRKRGMTLQAIADKLNSEGKPTLRGGQEWRPSSVRVVLNRKRVVSPFVRSSKQTSGAKDDRRPQAAQK